jgi:penicillin G amidase
VRRILLFLSVVVLAAAAYGVFTVRQSFPLTDGELAVPGLDDRVEVIRDDLGVPHIYANTEHDLFFTQGYTHAQDRFWQMDFWRHIGSGRLAELFGASQVETDMFLRSLGFAALAEEEWQRMEPTSWEVLQAYTDGVNAYLEGRSGASVSLEYAVLSLQNSTYEIEPWTPIDTLMWPKVMAWDLAGNMGAEISRAVLGVELSPDEVERLFPPMPEGRPVIVESGQEMEVEDVVRPDLSEETVPALLAARAGFDRVMEVTGGGFEGIGSNNWAVGGAMTASGLPILANDTHLANQMPSIWYGIGLHCVEVSESCRYSMVGFSFAGTPGVVIGHNGYAAWGVTNQAADTQDLFIERVNPDNSRQYEVEGDWVDFDVRTEILRVAGGEDVTYDVLMSRHGPVISGTYLDREAFVGSSTVETSERHVVALSWRALEPSSIFDAFLGINLASSYEEFAAAVELWDIAPQNLVYADVDGNVAYFATGELPMRATGDGRYPVPGWTSEYDWTGYVTPDQMPRMLNPPQGYIQSANQAVLRPGQLPLIGTDSSHGFRASRIVDLVTATDTHDVATSQLMQMDGRDGGAEILVPYLLAVDGRDDPVLSRVQERLTGWSSGANAFQADPRSAGAALYMATWRQVLVNTFHDQLPEDYWPEGGSRWFEVMRQLLELPDDIWWDDTTTPEAETRDQILAKSMRDAHEELTKLLGDDDSSWSWGELHIARFENQSLGQSGIGVIDWLFNRTAPARVGGSQSVLNAVGWDTASSYEVDWVPSQRMVVDLADLDSSTFVHTTGQSGHAFHQHYDSMIEMWVDGEHGPMPWTRPAVEAAAADILTLAPPGR